MSENSITIDELFAVAEFATWRDERRIQATRSESDYLSLMEFKPAVIKFLTQIMLLESNDKRIHSEDYGIRDMLGNRDAFISILSDPDRIIEIRHWLMAELAEEWDKSTMPNDVYLTKMFGEVIHSMGFHLPEKFYQTPVAMSHPEGALNGLTPIELIAAWIAFENLSSVTLTKGTTGNKDWQYHMEYWKYIQSKKKSNIYRLLTLKKVGEYMHDVSIGDAPADTSVKEYTIGIMMGLFTQDRTFKDPSFINELTQHLWSYIKTENLGGAWSQNPISAIAFWRSSKPYAVLLKGSVSVESIDWLMTFLLAFSYSKEFELRIFPKAKITLENIGVIGPFVSSKRYPNAQYRRERLEFSYALQDLRSNLEELSPKKLENNPSIIDLIRIQNKAISRRFLRWLHPEPEEGMA